MEPVKSISPDDRRPLYVKAISAITEMVETGQIPVGSQLPPEAKLAKMLGISRSTLREALSHLETYGMVTRQQGRGTFITASQGPNFMGGLERLETFRQLAERANKDHDIVERTVDLIVPAPEIRETFNLQPGEKIICVRIVESVDQVPCMYLEDYLIADESLKDELNTYQKSMLTYLIDQKDPPLTYSRTKIFAIPASTDIARKLSIEDGQPVLHLQEILYDAMGDLMGVTYMYLVTDQFYFSVTRRVPQR